MRSQPAPSRLSRAFTLIELLLVVAIIALLISILLPAIAKARRTAQTSVCSSNMRQLGIANATYGSDYKDLIPALNWRPGVRNGDTALSNIPAGDGILIIQGKHAKDIADRRWYRTLPLVQNRYFNRNYWHLILIDGGYFSNSNMIQSAVACPSDEVTKTWQRNPDNIPLLTTNPETSAIPNGAYEQYRPFWTTYQLVPVAFSVDKRPALSLPGAAAIFPAFAYADFHHIYQNASFPIGQRKFSDVAYPSQKVYMFDPFDRHGFKRPIWHAYDNASQPLLFFDTSVRFKKNLDCDLGWRPEAPSTPTAATDPRNGRQTYVWTTYRYDPTTGFRALDYPTLSGNPSDIVKGYFRWTAEGLKGTDFRR